MRRRGLMGEAMLEAQVVQLKRDANQLGQG